MKLCSFFTTRKHVELKDLFRMSSAWEVVSYQAYSLLLQKLAILRLLLLRHLHLRYFLKTVLVHIRGHRLKYLGTNCNET